MVKPLQKRRSHLEKDVSVKMPYRKKQGRKGKRKGRGRKKASVGMRITPLRVSRALEGPRLYMKENRDSFIAGAQNVVAWRAILARNTHSNFATIRAQAGQDAGGVVVLDAQNDVRFEGGYQQIHFRNVSNHACYFSIYTVKARDNYSTGLLSDIDGNEHCMNDFFLHYDSQLQAAQAAAAGTILAHTSGTSTMTSTSAMIVPPTNGDFALRWKIIKSANIRLAPGDDYHHSYALPPVTEKYSMLYEDSGGVAGEVIANKTIVNLVGVRGVLGKNTLDTKTGWVQTDIAYEDRFRIRYFRLRGVDRSMPMSDVSVSAAIGTMEAPTEFAQADENL